MTNDIKLFSDYIRESYRIVFFGGAGVSTESGLPDYRSKDGIYRTARDFGRPPEEILSRDCFFSDPELFYRFYRAYFMTEAEPNGAHRAIASLEDVHDVTVVTQNIDGLHQAAGSRRVLELHGTTSRLHCTECGKTYGAEYLRRCGTNVPRCACGGLIKPDVTLYGEPLDPTVTDAAVRAISRAELLIVGGTSLSVYPAAGFVRAFGGKHAVVINRDSTGFDTQASLVFRRSISEVLSEAVAESRQSQR